MSRMVKITIPEQLTEDNCLNQFYSNDEGLNHIAWETQEGKVLVMESGGFEYPDTKIIIYNSVQEYLDSLRDAGWVEFSPHFYDRLEELGIDYE